MKKITLIGLLALMGFSLVGCDRSPENVADHIAEKVSDKLDLNQNQQAKLEEIKILALEEFKAKKENVDKKKELIKKMVLSEKLDKQVVEKAMSERQKQSQMRFEKFFPLIQDFHSSLSEEQKQKLVEIIEKMAKKRHGHWR